ncbi:MAG: hypothetical protein F6K00_12580 [Leptolyngbya sp. SIOISBB]|nr:hypothetical protein [Leptolyngbya sp. SIOISBB]
MILLINPASQVPHPEAVKPVRLTHPAADPGREALRHLLIGSPDSVRSAIHQLHVLRYAEQATWSQLLTIPESGILITPEQGQVMSYLIRQRPMR